MEKIFKDKVAIVTGGSSGIGRATAIAFAQRGAKVVVADCNEDTETLQYVAANGGEGIFIHCDVSAISEVRKMIEKVIEKYGRLDFAFNNAGVEGDTASTHECTEQNWDKTIGINLKGIWLCMKMEIPQMLKQGKGVIINCASIAGLKGFAGSPAYVASKHGVVGLTKTAALDYAKQNIRINAVCPGVIHTAMIDRITHRDKEAEQQFAGMAPVNRMGTAEEIAETVMWLCSDAASFVTGTAIPVDGGTTA